MRTLHLIPPVAALLALAAGSLDAQAVSGRVLDDETDEPVAGVRVALLDNEEAVVGRTLTDADGSFRLEAEGTGRYRLSAERIGYEPVASPPLDLSASDTLAVELRMAVGAVPLAPLTVTGATRRSIRNRAMDGFYERQRSGWGRYYGPADIERLRPWNVTDILHRVPGVRVRYYRTSVSVTMGRGGRECAPTVYLDGSRLPRGTGPDDWVTGSSLYAVEVYPSASGVPPEFASVQNWECGVIVLWTRLQER